jgi:hypothetical protein
MSNPRSNRPAALTPTDPRPEGVRVVTTRRPARIGGLGISKIAIGLNSRLAMTQGSHGRATSKGGLCV